MKTTSKKADIYIDRRGRTISLSGLDKDERRLLNRLIERAGEKPDWNEFDGFWWREVAKLYDGRGLARAESLQSPVYQVAKDLSSRLAIS